MVSVVMPFLNTGAFIQQALESLSSQSFTDFEVLMIDDGSTDDSTDVACEFVRSDSRFRLLRSGSGFVSSLNLGLREAAGEWIARFDSDDVCHPLRLELQLQAALTCGVRTVITSRVRSFPNRDVSDGYRIYEEWVNSTVDPLDIEHSLFIESPVPHPTAFYHRQGVIEAGGYRDLGLPEDYELWLRLWSLGYSFFRVPRVLVGWRERSDRLSRNSSCYSLTSFYRTKAEYLEHVPCLKGKKVYIAGTGQCARRLAREIKKAGFRIEAFLSPGDEKSGERSLKGIPIVSACRWDSSDGIPVLVASRQPGAVAAIRGFLEEQGLENWKDFVICS